MILAPGFPIAADGEQVVVTPWSGIMHYDTVALSLNAATGKQESTDSSLLENVYRGLHSKLFWASQNTKRWGSHRKILAIRYVNKLFIYFRARPYVYPLLHGGILVIPDSVKNDCVYSQKML